MDPDRLHIFRFFGKAVSSALKSPLLKNSLSLGVLSFFASVIMVAFHVYSSRRLEPAEYGELGLMISIISGLLILLSSFYLIINRFITQYISRSQTEKVKFLIKMGFFDSFMLGFASFVIILLLSRVLAEFFHLKSPSTMVFFGALVWVTFLSPVLEGVFKGMNSFKQAGIFKFLEAAMRLGLVILFFSLASSVNAALAAMSIGTLLAILFCLRPLYVFKNTNSHKIYLAEFYHYAFPVIGGSFAVATLLNLDIVLVKHFFTPHEAGLFAAASILAKIPFTFSVMLGGVLFSQVSDALSNGRPTRGLLKKTLASFSAVSMLFLLIMLAFKKTVISAIFGPNYNISEFIVIYMVAMLLFSFTNIFVLYEWARNKYGGLWVLFTGLVALLVLLLRFHSSLLEVSLVLLAVMAALFAAVFWKVRKEFFYF